jgi:fructose-bisphosphate aldolase class 1
MGPAVVNTRQLTETAQALVGCGRGLLAMDESEGT